MTPPLSYIEILRANLIHNLKSFKKILPKDTKLVAVVKANAYGHGLREVISIAEKYIDYFQVDDIDELKQLRLYSKRPTLVFGYVEKASLEEAVVLGAILGVYNKETLLKLNAIGKKYNKKIRIHLKIDTLLGRQGVLLDEVKEYGNFIKKLPYITLDAVYSHFSNIEDTQNLSHANKQHKQLLEAKELLQKLDFSNLSHHISATSGLLADPVKNWGSSFLRLGIGLYGEWPSEHLKNKYSHKLKIKPVLRWISHLAQVKTIPKGYPVGYGLTFVSKKSMTIGVVPQGYSDGYDRGFSNTGMVLVQGKRCPVVGRVAMNMFVIDLTLVKKPQLEDEVVLLGSQGKGEITADFCAKQIKTINYEITTRISPLLPRVIK